MSEVLNELYEERHARMVADASRRLPSVFKIWRRSERLKILDARDYVRGFNWVYKNAGQNNKNLRFLKMVVKFGAADPGFHLGASDAVHQKNVESDSRSTSVGFALDA